MRSQLFAPPSNGASRAMLSWCASRLLLAVQFAPPSDRPLGPATQEALAALAQGRPEAADRHLRHVEGIGSLSPLYWAARCHVACQVLAEYTHMVPASFADGLRRGWPTCLLELGKTLGNLPTRAGDDFALVLSEVWLSQAGELRDREAFVRARARLLESLAPVEIQGEMGAASAAILAALLTMPDAPEQERARLLGLIDASRSTQADAAEARAEIAPHVSGPPIAPPLAANAPPPPSRSSVAVPVSALGGAAAPRQSPAPPSGSHDAIFARTGVAPPPPLPPPAGRGDSPRGLAALPAPGAPSVPQPNIPMGPGPSSLGGTVRTGKEKRKPRSRGQLAALMTGPAGIVAMILCCLGFVGWAFDWMMDTSHVGQDSLSDWYEKNEAHREREKSRQEDREIAVVEAAPGPTPEPTPAPTPARTPPPGLPNPFERPAPGAENRSAQSAGGGLFTPEETLAAAVATDARRIAPRVAQPRTLGTADGLTHTVVSRLTGHEHSLEDPNTATAKFFLQTSLNGAPAELQWLEVKYQRQLDGTWLVTSAVRCLNRRDGGGRLLYAMAPAERVWAQGLFSE
ncbi:MAG: hypothetical protein RLY93_20905 [Sumerlaeia bacterium]